MNLMIQIETDERRDMTSLIAAVAAYLATFARVEPPRSPRHFVRTDRAGTVAVAFHELGVEPVDELAADELPAAVARFIRDILRRSGARAEVTILYGATVAPSSASAT